MNRPILSLTAEHGRVIIHWSERGKHERISQARHYQLVGDSYSVNHLWNVMLRNRRTVQHFTVWRFTPGSKDTDQIEGWYGDV